MRPIDSAHDEKPVWSVQCLAMLPAGSYPLNWLCSPRERPERLHDGGQADVEFGHYPYLRRLMSRHRMAPISAGNMSNSKSGLAGRSAKAAVSPAEVGDKPARPRLKVGVKAASIGPWPVE